MKFFAGAVLSIAGLFGVVAPAAAVCWQEGPGVYICCLPSGECVIWIQTQPK